VNLKITNINLSWAINYKTSIV